MHSCLSVESCGASTRNLEHVNFFTRQLLTADDMTTERDYFLEKLRRHNRFMHGWGVVCGLNVVAAPNADEPWSVQVEPGYALGPYGDEIFVGEAAFFDLAACLTASGADPCEPGLTKAPKAGTSSTVYLAIKYAECMGRPVKVAYSGCGCDDDPCQYSRVRDGFQLQCLTELPPQNVSPVDLCEAVRGAIAPCPPCPTSPWVVLAKIVLPSSNSAKIMNSSIDVASVRRVILSTAVLQEQIVNCCCGPVSSSSASSSTATFRSRQELAGAVVLNVAPRATAVANSRTGATQFAVTVINSGVQAADDVVLTVDLSPQLDPKEFTLTAAKGWDVATLTELKSAPIRLAPGKAQTFSFQVAPVGKTPAAKVVLNASAASAASGASHAAAPLDATIGK
jgi:hypothetical protein